MSNTNALVLILLATVLTGCGIFGYESSNPPPERIVEPQFQPIEVPFQHRWQSETSHPLVGAAAIDVDGDGDDEVFVGGGAGQASALLNWQQGSLIDIAQDWGIEPEMAIHGALSVDLDRDGAVDLLTTGEDGLLYWRNTGGSFVKEPIAFTTVANSTPMAANAADVDLDGDIDLYLSMFVDAPNFQTAVFNDPIHAKDNVLLINDGNGGFETRSDGDLSGLQNTFVSALADLDGDGYPEILLAQNTGEVEILHNQGGQEFKRIDLPTGYGFWMGVGLGDIDGDRDVDLFFSNAGNSVPGFLVSGDLRDDQPMELEWLILRNDGAMSFTDVTQEVGATGFGFAWGGVFEDINGDGAQDLLVAQNYVKWPVHKWLKLPGKNLLGDPEGTPRFYTSLELENADFGDTPLLADVNGDGRKDIFWINMDGPVKGYININEHPQIAVRIPDDGFAEGLVFSVAGAHAFHLPQQGLGSDQASLMAMPVPDDMNEVLLEVLDHKGQVRHSMVVPPGSITNLSPKTQ